MRLAYSVLIPLLPLYAQQFPDASTVLAQHTHSMDRYQTYQYTTDMTMEMNVAGNPMKIPMTSTLSADRQGRMRMEMGGMAGMGGSTMVSDGKTMWTYIPMLKQYSKTTGDSAMKEEMATANLGALADPAKLAANAKVIRDESLQADGQRRDCWVVESRIDDIAVPGGAPGSIQGGVYTLWIDKQNGIDWQVTMSGKMQAGPMVTDMKMTTLKHDVKLNVNLPDSLFVFTPPADAKEVAAFNAPGRGPEPTPTATPAPAAKLEKPLAPGEPQAYVPMMTPLDLVEPVFPEAARKQGVSGMVRVLVTLDSQGLVTNAEALTGPEILRQPAIETVRQSKFKPVLRDGKPVAAFTDQMVNFFDRTIKSSRDFNPADEMAAVSRISELEARWPRSKQQVLADLEADHDVADPERSFVLPQLAKAALDAGELGKAESYARESLHVREPGPMNGDGIHTANNILGLLALRNGNVAQANQYLLEAGRVQGGAVLGSFGPNMRLAKELLQKGERDVVLEYFSLCRKFWTMGGKQLDAWTATVRSGGIPEFGANLEY